MKSYIQNLFPLFALGWILCGCNIGIDVKPSGFTQQKENIQEYTLNPDNKTHVIDLRKANPSLGKKLEFKYKTTSTAKPTPKATSMKISFGKTSINTVLNGGDVQTLFPIHFDVTGADIAAKNLSLFISEVGKFDAEKHARLFRLYSLDYPHGIKTQLIWSGPWNAVDTDSEPSNRSGAKLTMHNMFIFPKGRTTLYLSAVIRAEELKDGNHGFQVSIDAKKAFSIVKDWDTKKILVPTQNGNLVSPIFLLNRAKLTASMDETSNKQTILKSSINALLATATLNTNKSAEKQKVLSITIGMGRASTAKAEDFANYKLFYQNNQIGETEQHTTKGGFGKGSIVFNIDNGVVLNPNIIAKLTLHADPLSSLSNNAVATFTVLNVSSIGVTSGYTVSALSVQNQSAQVTFVETGHIQVESQSLVGIYTTGGKQFIGAEYTMTSYLEDMYVEDIPLFAAQNSNFAKAAPSGTITSIAIQVNGKLIGKTFIDMNGKAVIKVTRGAFVLKNNTPTKVSILVQISTTAQSQTDFSVGIAGRDGTAKNWGNKGFYGVKAMGTRSGLYIKNITSASGFISGGRTFVIK